MAPRILNFLKRQMYWECDEIGASEVLPYGVESQLLQVPAKAHNPFMLRNLDHEDLNLERPRSPSFPYKLEISPTVKKALQIWGMAVRDYTARNSRNYKNLSNPADKLVAISAIMLMYDTEKIHFHPLAEIMSVNVEPLTEDAMGQVKSGELVLKGQILDLEVKEWYHSWGSLRFHGKISDQMAKLDDDASPPPTPYSIKCVPIGLSFELPRPGDEHPRWRFRSIIVEQTGTEGVYKRVGFVGAYGLTEGKDRFMSDPVLQTLGTLDWSKEGIPEFSLNTEGMQVLRII
ncbi:hypothetical protein E8E14_011915 [Neopestalotiopsis sp. 37M]|nr:hypothetical protein E8E14_011915 [Neopestalotiopsis sp. 37M]